MKFCFFILTLSVSVSLYAQPTTHNVERQIAVHVVATPTVVGDFDFEIESRAAERLAATMTLRKQEWANLTADAIADTHKSRLTVVDEPEIADVILEITDGYDDAIAPYVRGLRFEAVLRAGARTQSFRMFSARSFEDLLPNWLPRLERTIQSFAEMSKLK